MTDPATDWKLPLTGRCRCGAVAVTVSKPPLVTMACHCRGCQAMTGGAFSLSVAVPDDGFDHQGADPVRGGTRGEGIAHFFCPDCMSWMFTRIEMLPGMVNLRATMLDDPAWAAPFVETQTDEKLPFAHVDAVASFARFPEMAEMQDLVERFAREGPRP
ncbi:Glutathione-dependent formaldehyde-activating enzyme [Roseivivax jejudonensis]|uniref:Glutathione-dependent formaldehyde-activating enzyme n=1 Tax=Roseivivax jejudonensis TaxID=1529041 RepID=A0A1X6ZJC5_9RHOB|nr:GFA family protein [Roseivivax jejudonensis]SLN53084.1 Glutathione-dependent formaldehyde-activating enzyme [Roseivivax jejudonensis]